MKVLIYFNRGSGSGKTNSLFNLKNHQPDIDKLYFYAKGQYEAKYQLLIVAFIEYSNDMDDIIILLKNTMKIKNVNIC